MEGGKEIEMMEEKRKKEEEGIIKIKEMKKGEMIRFE